jgi:hypothetical protein
MSPTALALIAFSCVFLGTLLALVLRAFLPEHHLSDDSKDVVKLGIGMVATLAALVLGLLLASAKGNFDTMSNELKQAGAKIVLLDSVMAEYGPETREARDLLRQAVTAALQRLWPEETNKAAPAHVPKPGNDLDALQSKLRRLSPHNDTQRSLQSRALQVSADIAEARWLLLTQAGHGSIQKPFLVLLIFWLTIIFAGFGLLSPRNATVIVVLVVCILSATGSLYLILELDRPYGGLIKISSAPLHTALMYMGP